MKPVRFAVVVLVLGLFCVSIAQSAPINVTYTVQTDVNRTPISKYVYGSNWGGGTDYTIRRSGGNRLTAYNWENNFSNAGSDWYYSNDQYLVRDIPEEDRLIPGIAITDNQDLALSQGQTLIVTLQMAGYVSADGDGNVILPGETAPSTRFKSVVFAKGSPFCSPPGSPDPCDANVYMDEFVNFLVSTYGYAGTANGVKFYDLDNEPDLWSSTHKEVHPAQTGCAEYKNLSTAMSTAVKNVDPNAQILGPVSYGFSGYLTFQGAPDWGTVGAGYPWFLSYYLHKMGQDSNTAGKRLLDALDVHWYPEAQDGSGHRILGDVKTRNMYTARMQAPRTLWDTGYVYPNMTFPNGEVSWLNQQWSAQYLPIITRLKTDIKNYYPDTNLAITEYAYGPDDDPENGIYISHWSTGIATADFLGICGKYGVQVTTYWGRGSYVDAAIKMYTNYNGAKGKFGDMNVPAGLTNKVDSSIHASVNSTGGTDLHLIVLNKNQDSSINGTFNITSSTNYTKGRVFMFDGNSPAITERTGISGITGNTFTYTLPPVSVGHIVLTNICPPGDLDHDCGVDMNDFDMFADQWLNPSLSCPGSNCADLIGGDNQINFNDFAILAQDWRL